MNGTQMSASKIFEELIGRPIASPYKEALLARETLLQQSLNAYQAVLTPQETGLWSHALRAALAMRIVTLTQSLGAANGIRKYAATTEFDGWLKDVAQATPVTHTQAPVWLDAVLAYTDTLTLYPQKATNSLIDSLKQKNVDDADCVRLAELVATLSYQIRLIVGFQALQA